MDMVFYYGEPVFLFPGVLSELKLRNMQSVGSQLHISIQRLNIHLGLRICQQKLEVL